ncbi:MAG: hypothetical protein LBT05_09205 [Planctomycetaceae bacterium]|nr:hypothetical protein [Planctomycetaceae bacterium]
MKKERETTAIHNDGLILADVGLPLQVWRECYEKFFAFKWDVRCRARKQPTFQKKKKLIK